MNWISAKTPPPIKEEYCGFSRSEDVLMTDGKSRIVGHYEEWDSDDGGIKETVWREFGRDGYRMDGAIAWMPLPDFPTNMA